MNIDNIVRGIDDLYSLLVIDFFKNWIVNNITIRIISPITKPYPSNSIFI